MCRRILAASAVLALLGGCSASPPEKAPEGLNVVATTTQICDYLTHVAQGTNFSKTDSQGQTTTTGSGETELNLTCLLAPNASAHDHEMTAQQMSALGKADILFVNGLDLEHFLDQAIESSGFHGSMAVTSGIVGSGPAASDTPYSVDQGRDKVTAAHWPFDPEPGEEAEFEFDPHVWTSPRGAQIQVRNIGASLDEASKSDGEWTRRADAYAAQLGELDEWVRESLETVPETRRVLFTSHDAFGYFARDYGVNFFGSALSDFNAQQDATADHIRTGVQQVRDANAQVIFAENSNSAKSIEAVGRAAGVRVITGDDALYGDSLGPAGTDGETYAGSILHNVTNLVRAWGGTPAPVPDALAEFAPKDTI
ncbi:Periplasmic zinc-binding protein TroA precursor [Corynebacterium capitovis DSM 44611]|uniref:metal ABC transporter substrate-binding protein n=1 Tax=Corynebacterium capitovis TaxID=131081 RepID=UPI00037FF8BB|nr:metal ABC transporter substrate-binding protein [Corynebacterium capitovis]WKD57128.1 Periplasmic zinc-binding protein TroA precursor [Corynebacterium capitovis DSM 44611]